MPLYGNFRIQKISLFFLLIAMSVLVLTMSRFYTWPILSSLYRISNSNSLHVTQTNYPVSSYDYVALGDSYSAGQTPYGVDSGYSYTDMIKEKLESEGLLGSYSKKGVSGYRTVEVINQLKGMGQLINDAEIITIDIGINDLLLLDEALTYMNRSSTMEFEPAKDAMIKKIPEATANLKKIIISIKETKSEATVLIYVMGYFDAFPDSPEYLPIIKKLNDAIRDVTVETNVTYVDTMAVINEKHREYLPGDIHPTVEGYRAIAEEFWKAIQKDIAAHAPDDVILNDIAGHWAENDILKFLREGYAIGYEDGSFKPDNHITRGEFITLINKMYQFSAQAEIRFKDVPEGAWYKAEVQKAMKAGYISGYDDNTFRANNEVTRQEAAVMLAKLLKLDLSEGEGVSAQFVDGADIPSWSRGSFNVLIRNGILTGYLDNSIRYLGKLTRAEALSMLSRMAE